MPEPAPIPPCGPNPGCQKRRPPCPRFREGEPQAGRRPQEHPRQALGLHPSGGHPLQRPAPSSVRPTALFSQVSGFLDKVHKASAAGTSGLGLPRPSQPGPDSTEPPFLHLPNGRKRVPLSPAYREMERGWRGDSGQEGTGSRRPPGAPVPPDMAGITCHQFSARPQGMQPPCSLSRLSWGQEGPWCPVPAASSPFPGYPLQIPEQRLLAARHRGRAQTHCPLGLASSRKPSPTQDPCLQARPSQRGQTQYAARTPGLCPLGCASLARPLGAPSAPRSGLRGSCPGDILRTSTDKELLRAQTPGP